MALGPFHNEEEEEEEEERAGPRRMATENCDLTEGRPALLERSDSVWG